MAIDRLKNRKAVGIDSIPNEVLKNDHVKTVLYKFFQGCFDTGWTPSVWLRVIISPIYKGAHLDPHQPTNYRAVSLLSCVSKVYTYVLSRRIDDYCDIAGLC